MDFLTVIGFVLLTAEPALGLKRTFALPPSLIVSFTVVAFAALTLRQRMGRDGASSPARYRLRRTIHKCTVWSTR
jgi:hypothetical protein